LSSDIYGAHCSVSTLGSTIRNFDHSGIISAFHPRAVASLPRESRNGFPRSRFLVGWRRLLGPQIQISLAHSRSDVDWHTECGLLTVFFRPKRNNAAAYRARPLQRRTGDRRRAASRRFVFDEAQLHAPERTRSSCPAGFRSTSRVSARSHPRLRHPSIQD